MAGEYQESDVDGLGRVAILVDGYYRTPQKELLAEIRLQEARFGLSPVDRIRLHWEIKKVEEADKQARHLKPTTRPYKHDPRQLLQEARQN